MPRRADYDPDGTGARPHTVHDMPPIYVVPSHPDYWEAVTDVPCPCCAAGTVRWGEARHGPYLRACDGCDQVYVAGGSAEAPILIEVE